MSGLELLEINYTNEEARKMTKLRFYAQIYASRTIYYSPNMIISSIIYWQADNEHSYLNPHN